MIKRILKWTFGLVLLTLFVWFEIAYWTSTNDCDQKKAPTNPMKAIVYCDYGLANLKLAEIEKPTPPAERITSVKVSDDFIRKAALGSTEIEWPTVGESVAPPASPTAGRSDRADARDAIRRRDR